MVSRGRFLLCAVGDLERGWGSQVRERGPIPVSLSGIPAEQIVKKCVCNTCHNYGLPTTDYRDAR